MGLIKFIIIGILIFIVATAFYTDFDEHNIIEGFCMDNGYSGYEKAQWKYENSYCTKVKDNIIIKKQIQRCNHRGVTLHDWCFVEVSK